MAPRGRHRKSRNTRMDAAIDSMTKVYGFSEEIVKKVLKELLEEYGGDDGWFFIEQYSYKELVDAILRDQEENDHQMQDNPSNQKADTFPGSGSLQDEKAEGHTSTNDAEPSGGLAGTICSEAVENKSETTNKENVDHLPPTERNGRAWKDIGLDQSSSQREIADGNCGKDDKSGPSSILLPPPLTPTTPLGTSLPSRPDNNPVFSPSPMVSSPPSVKNNTRKGREPCYGWIGSDEEEVDDFLYLLPPAKDWEDLSSVADKKAKHKSRWDLRPEDP
ncbi:hypothetical protein ACH5RR_016792 [Cinchona calisaya]|uniref:WIYLD domain-containing protein n=1 Tax=Cinchona calisaya TaxID=153742 RepID=A0ABD2ZY63_9GENT